MNPKEVLFEVSKNCSLLIEDLKNFDSDMNFVIELTQKETAKEIFEDLIEQIETKLRDNAHSEQLEGMCFIRDFVVDFKKNNV